MASEIVKVGQAIRDAINAVADGTFVLDVAGRAEFTFRPTIDKVDATNLLIVVVPGADAAQVGTRGKLAVEVAMEIGVVQRVANEADPKIATLLEFTEQLRAWLITRTIADDYVCAEISRDVPYLAQHLTEQGMFVSILGATMRGDKAIVQTVPFTATLSLDLTSGVAGSTVFTATASASGGTSPYTYSVAWGDGNTDTLDAEDPTESHTYAAGAGGSRTVTLTVTDADGRVATRTAAVTLAASLSASLSLASSTGTAGGTSIAATASAAGGTSPYSYSINWGDGSAATAGANGSHTYATAGTYSVVATATDAAGRTAASAGATVTITGAASSVGWTDLEPSEDSLTIYVSSSTGNDANPGTEAQPKATIAAAYAALRSGSPDWILLKRGDVFVESLGWLKSGRSATEPTVLTAYGTGARPSIQPSASDHGNWTWTETVVNYVALIGVEFCSKNRDPATPGYSAAASPTGFYFSCPGTYLLIEDCAFRFFGTNLVLGGRGAGALARNTTILRRNVIADAYSTIGHSQGLLMGETNGITIVENVFDHNGWNETVSGAEKTIFNHNMYVHESNLSENNIVSGNIIARGSSHGLQLRRGGTIEDNLAIDNAIGLQPGGGDTPTPGGVVGNMRRNVILECGDIASAPRGTGIVLKGNIRDSSIVGNIIADDRSAAAYANGIQVESGVVRTALTDNIVFDVANPTDIQSGASVTQSGNYYGVRNGPNTPGYLAPTRNAAGYHASLGGTATNAAFLTACRGQSRATWSDTLTAIAANAWIRAGFEVAA